MLISGVAHETVSNALYFSQKIRGTYKAKNKVVRKLIGEYCVKILSFFVVEAISSPYSKEHSSSSNDTFKTSLSRASSPSLSLLPLPLG